MFYLILRVDHKLFSFSFSFTCCGMAMYAFLSSSSRSGGGSSSSLRAVATNGCRRKYVINEKKAFTDLGLVM